MYAVYMLLTVSEQLSSLDLDCHAWPSETATSISHLSALHNLILAFININSVVSTYHRIIE